MNISNDRYEQALLRAKHQIQSGLPLTAKSVRGYGGIALLDCSWGLCSTSSDVWDDLSGVHIRLHPWQRCPLDVRSSVEQGQSFDQHHLQNCFYSCRLFTGSLKERAVTRENVIKWYDSRIETIYGNR